MRIKLDIPLSIKDIKNYFGIKYTDGDDKKFIDYICTDSRIASPGDLFIALKGDRYDAEQFTSAAKKRCALIMSTNKSLADFCVKDTKEALLGLCKLYRSKLKKLKEVVCITGSVGKTTTRELTEMLLSGSYRLHTTKGNLNNEFGVPFTVLQAPRDTEILLIEAGMNAPHELWAISNAINPTLSVITNIGTAHIGNLGSRKMIAEAKLEICDGMKREKLIVPYDEPLLNRNCLKKTVSTFSGDADYYLKSVTLSQDGGLFEFFNGNEHISLRCPAFGYHISECLSFALAISCELGISKEFLCERCAKIPSMLSRVKYYKLGPISVLEDAYNSSFEAVISALKTLKLFTAERYCALLGDILELGSHTEELHRRIGSSLCGFGLNCLYTLGAYSEFIANEAEKGGIPPSDIHRCNDILSPEYAAQLIYENSKVGDILLVKASHAIDIGRVIKILKVKFEQNEGALP